MSVNEIMGMYVNMLIRDLIKAVGLHNADQYSAHSSRRGFATEAARLGASMTAIQKHGCSWSTCIVVEYIESERWLEDSAVSVLFEFL